MDWDALEQDAFRFLGLLPTALYEMTPREYKNALAGREKQLDDELHRMAVQAIMYRKAMNKKTLKFRDLLGKKNASSITKRVDLQTKAEVLNALELEVGVPTR